MRDINHSTEATQRDANCSGNWSAKFRRARRIIGMAAGSMALISAMTASYARGEDTTPTTSTSPAASTATTASTAAANVTLEGNLNLLAGRTTVINTDSDVRTVSTGDPTVADVQPVGTRAVLITAKKPGTTQILVWDGEDKRPRVINATVRVDMASLTEQIKQMFPAADVQVTGVPGGVALRGRVPDAQTSAQLETLAGAGGMKVMNFTQVAGGQQVMLQVKFAEVSRSATDALGVNLGIADGVMFAGSNIGQVSPLGIIGATGNTAPSLGVPTPSAAVTQFGRGMIGSTAFDYFVTALRQNNLLRILAEPNLVATSGQEASFLAGGEYPIPVTQGGGSTGGTAVTVEFKEFGVKLKMTPVVLGGGRVKINVAPEVSDLDFTTAVRFNGFLIPGLTSRKINTTVELNEGQTFAIAGLLNHSISATKDVTPVLGDVPVIGALFRSVRYQKKETELVVLVTPRIVEGMNPAQVPPVPGETWRHPTEGELFLNQDLGGPTAPGHVTQPSTAVPSNGSQPRAAVPQGDHQPPAFQGEYGFVEDPSANKPAAAAPESDKSTADGRE
jgi:pilus assembly protein CpaC